jgi:hypothetical protein
MFTTPQQMASPSLSAVTSVHTDTMYRHPDYRASPSYHMSGGGGDGHYDGNRFVPIYRMESHPPASIYGSPHYNYGRPASWADWHSQLGDMGREGSQFTEEYEVVHYEDLMLADKEAHRLMHMHGGEGDYPPEYHRYSPTPPVRYPLAIGGIGEDGPYYDGDSDSLGDTAQLSDWGDMIRCVCVY